MKLMKYNPFGVSKSFDNFFPDNFWTNISDFAGSDFFLSNPSTNVTETADSFKIELAAPGLDKEDFQINIENDNLTIEANKESKTEEKDEQFMRREFNYASFKRSFHLPDSVDTEGIKAAYKNGVLNLTLPKKDEAKVQPVKKIDIS